MLCTRSIRGGERRDAPGGRASGHHRAALARTAIITENRPRCTRTIEIVARRSDPACALRRPPPSTAWAGSTLPPTRAEQRRDRRAVASLRLSDSGRGERRPANRRRGSFGHGTAPRSASCQPRGVRSQARGRFLLRPVGLERRRYPAACSELLLAVQRISESNAGERSCSQIASSCVRPVCSCFGPARRQRRCCPSASSWSPPRKGRPCGVLFRGHDRALRVERVG